MVRALLLIADIGGYTRFMKVTAANLSHSQQMVADLLEAVIDAASPLKLAKLEGDAAFFYLPLKNGLPEAEEAERLIARMQTAFRATLMTHQVRDLCDCDACMNSGQLTLKFVAHVGEIAFQKVKKLTELAGVDVILVHRMLKNDVPMKEYLLMTEPLVDRAPPSLRPALSPLKHDFEGLGEVQTFYAPLDALPVHVPEVKKPGFVASWVQQLGFLWRALPYLLRLKRRAIADVVAPRV